MVDKEDNDLEDYVSEPEEQGYTDGKNNEGNVIKSLKT